MNEFTEQIAPGIGFSVTPGRLIHTGHTRFQRIDVFEHEVLGRSLALDGVVQTTESDEFIYHEMLVHTALVSHGAPRRVLIIGGGDGGTLREVLRHPVEQVVMVELDPDVVALCREHLPTLSAGAFDDARTELVFADGARYVAECETGFDAILIDSTDPVGPGKVLFETPFYRECRRLLGTRGVLVNQNGTPAFMPDALRDSSARLAEVFTHYGFFYVAVPTYVSGPMALGWASMQVAVDELSQATLQQRWDALDLALRYYTPAQQRAALVEPPYLRELRRTPRRG